MALHAALLVSLLVAPKPPQADPVASIPSLAEEDGKEADMRLIPTAQDGTGLACPNSYTGVGLYAWQDVIYEVVSGGPADRAGVRKGDTFLNASVFERDQWPVGKHLTLIVQREGQRVDLPVVIDAICFEKSPSSGSSSIPHLHEDRP